MRRHRTGLRIGSIAKMLPADLRMRSSGEFAATVRRGHREGSKTVVLHVWAPAEPDPGGSGAKIGFVVSKKVGTAVIRNQTKRRLRHLVRRLVEDRSTPLPSQLRVVLRALPAAARNRDRLAADLAKVWFRSVPEHPAPAGDNRRREGNVFVVRGHQS
jgi:ribonuclease P protein component